MDWSWIPQFGIQFHLAMDGLSLLLVLLTLFLGIVSVLASWTEITKGVGFFHFNLLWILAGIIGVFLALDLFLFYFAWELMLVPMYFLIAIWGHERRVYAAMKFFLFTQLSGLLMLIAILALYFAHHRATGIYTFEYADLLGTPLDPHTAMWIMLGFFIAFAVKLPMVPLHTWLADAHTEAPTAGSVILAGLLLKTGAYGLIRFVVPLFPGAARAFAPVAMTLAVIGILYGAILAFAPNRSEAPGRLYQHQPSRFRAAGSIRRQHDRATGRIDDDDLPRDQHRRALRRGRSAAGAHAHARNGRHGRPVGHRTPIERGRVILRSGVAGIAWTGRLHRRIPGSVGNLPRECRHGRRGRCWRSRSDFLCASFSAAGVPGAEQHNWQLPDLAVREGLMLGVMIALLLWLGLYPQPVFHMFAQAANQFPALWR